MSVVRSDKDGADPASVAFEASAKAKEENVDVLIIDTAGRLQNKANLMDELGKIRRRHRKDHPVDEVLLVLDATTGQNGMTQAKVFAEAIGITGVVLSKLDGSAKGGIVISVQKELWRARQARRPRRRPGRPRPVRSGRLRRRHPRLTFHIFRICDFFSKTSPSRSVQVAVFVLRLLPSSASRTGSASPHSRHLPDRQSFSSSGATSVTSEMMKMIVE